jgi:hypothetical protein
MTKLGNYCMMSEKVQHVICAGEGINRKMRILGMELDAVHVSPEQEITIMEDKNSHG